MRDEQKSCLVGPRIELQDYFINYKVVIETSLVSSLQMLLLNLFSLLRRDIGKKGN